MNVYGKHGNVGGLLSTIFQLDEEAKLHQNNTISRSKKLGGGLVSSMNVIFWATLPLGPSGFTGGI